MDSKFVNFPFKVKSSAIKILQARKGFDIYFIFEYIAYLRLSSEEHKRHYISEIEPLKILMPSYEAQQRIASILIAMDIKIANALKEAELYAQQKQYLLSNLFI